MDDDTEWLGDVMAVALMWCAAVLFVGNLYIAVVL